MADRPTARAERRAEGPRPPLPEGGVHVRIAARAREVRRRPWRMAGVAAATVLGLGLLVWVLLFSPLLAVRSVQVDGAPAAQRHTYLEAARVPVGGSMIRLDTKAVVDRLTARREVAGASLERRWPGTVVLHVERRQAVLAVARPAGGFSLVDAEGVAYGSAAQAPRGVPTATATTSSALSDDAVSVAVTAMSVVSPQLRAQVSKLVVSSASLVTFRAGSTTVIWGGSEESEQKAKILDILLRQKPRPAVVDVSAPASPVTR